MSEDRSGFAGFPLGYGRANDDPATMLAPRGEQDRQREQR